MKPARRDLRYAWRYALRIPGNVSRWLAVSEAMSGQDWPEAERRLEICFAGLELPMPSRDAIPKMNVAAASIAYWMNRPERALQALEVTIDQLKNGRVRKLSEASYLARYSFELAEFCAGRFSPDEPKFLEQAARAQLLIVPFNLRHIRDDFRRLFPLSDLPG
ncbi:MAG: hypothetical protein KKG14_03315 [Alphaproteobacteria bacterium]|nr:hypothetical protein [Alphaproteobacteria bacterium]MBU2270907.1 hypothetical protein [Alphaproteobacteria bacterium]MBU2417711.1 hypothetical protein [Alphaproteobacteria bacterium]